MTIARFEIIDTTLREGEQFALAHFSTADKLAIAATLNDFGVEYIEMTSPLASPQSEADLRAVVNTRRTTRVLTHVRCTMDDVARAVDCGVDGVNVLYGTSHWMRTHSHGRTIEGIIEEATAVIDWVRAQGVEIRFTCEDSFRTDPRDLVRVYSAVAAHGTERVGLADTVGIATPAQVTEITSRVRDAVPCDIEFHAHDDAGCAVANALSALEAGATHIDTTVLGIGERNGIVPLSAIIARVMTVAPDLVGNYELGLLPELDRMVSAMVGVPVPFNAPITGAHAFSHKAGMHTKAVLSDPEAYEILDPSRFGRSRHIVSGHRLMGWNALRHRADALGLRFAESELRALTLDVKRRADARPIGDVELDDLLRAAAAVPAGKGEATA
jgi:homocitrate synthase